jgi:hypothetical protein
VELVFNYICLYHILKYLLSVAGMEKKYERKEGIR